MNTPKNNIIAILKSMIDMEYAIRCEKINSEVSNNMMITIISLYRYCISHPERVEAIDATELSSMFSILVSFINIEGEDNHYLREDVLHKMQELLYAANTEALQQFA